LEDQKEMGFLKHEQIGY